MNGLNGKPTEYPENALVPYPVILAASKGDPDANYAQTECQFRYCGTAIPFLTVRSTAR